MDQGYLKAVYSISYLYISTELFSCYLQVPKPQIETVEINVSKEKATKRKLNKDDPPAVLDENEFENGE